MLDLVLKGLWETIYMTVGATVLAYIVGLRFLGFTGA